MVLDSLPLTVEAVVDGPGKLLAGAGAVETARGGAKLLSSTLGHASGSALSEHGGGREGWLEGGVVKSDGEGDGNGGIDRKTSGDSAGQQNPVTLAALGWAYVSIA